MQQNNNEINNIAEDEISLKELILKIKDWYRFLLTKWLVIVAAGIIGGAIGVARGAGSGDLPRDPLPFIGAAIRKADLASAIGLTRDELAFIDRAVGECRAAGATDLAHHPIALIFIARRQAIGAFAMLFAVFEGTLINAAIVVLFGLYILGKNGI